MGYFHILLLVPEQFSDLQENVFSDALLEDMYCSEVEMLMYKSLRPTRDMLLKLSHVTCDVEQESINVMTGALTLTQLAGAAPYYEQRLLIGIVRIRVAKKNVKNEQLGEAEFRIRPPLRKHQGRPSAIISQVVNGQFDATLGFDECKTSNETLTSTSSPCSVSKSTVRSDVAFYMASLSHEGIYTFTQVAKVKFPRSIAELPQFINMRAISQLLQASQCF
ncbi:hypothetical protein BCV72DRAFT_332741 [Rhizopus microsporus var. microsporus]|uniref:Uncharacterized protein n=1 Tax=Rhizopus microsporus var. microsporus TaxID=86635 RepID=A0A1X0RFQ0_RHIZD|nr:hypothetical protein BCV72DRAFT_332741 [Rhizopus microsporus var. microsporus]